MNLDALTRQLAASAQSIDRAGVWSTDLVASLTAAGAWGWSSPQRFGGAELSARDQVLAYEAVARGSMTAALILTQHDGAAQFLVEAAAANEPLAAVLQSAARGHTLLTVGISQLTTSRRGSGPAMRARKSGDAFHLTGLMPWVTSAPHADLIITGGVLDDGRQILAAIPRTRPGVTIAPPMQLAALQASATCEVHCADVEVAPADLLRGPVESALSRRAPVKSLTVSATGIGHAAALIDALDARRDRTPAALSPPLDDLRRAHAELREQILDTAHRRQSGETDTAGAVALRSRANDLLIRLAAANLLVSKGTGMLLDHHAQRLAREALFFLVWSAPEEVQLHTLTCLLAPLNNGA